ncbi:hypothetical protein FOMG_17725 [Fusarium oxysporum f. sp. melonis 26406]|uniref:Uncharacterized protein n=1 Tax=Fusarium oxysporum f. sp. melonis 26406 TaxID=1089452 RepID=W9Z1F9_FUSOX|nr:hypothetical protein FOMG_17725 [Fusarium oxysporum f. sp. melonis 26406]
MALDKLEELMTSNSSSLHMDVGDADPSAARSTLLMAQKGLSDQGKSYYFLQTISSMALDRMSINDSYLL